MNGFTATNFGTTICVVTYNRPNLLRALLSSLNGQEWSTDSCLKVMVVDNDPLQSAKHVIDEIRADYSLEISYICEPIPGISAARNAAIDNVKTPYFAFIDDDEVAEPTWIESLIQTAQSYDADAVFGGVRYVFPEGTARWMQQLRMYKSINCPTGTVLKHGATNNVLLRTSLIRNHGLRFRDEFGLTGGGDTDFSHRLGALGGRLIWCNENEVSETVIGTRTTLRWVLFRGFRGGQTYARVYHLQHSWLARIARVLPRVLSLPPIVIWAMLCGIFSPRIAVDSLHKAAGWAGQITVYMGFETYFVEYGRS
jgi:succinoglycan biosynthesis protein ExoM